MVHYTFQVFTIFLQNQVFQIRIHLILNHSATSGVVAERSRDGESRGQHDLGGVGFWKGRVDDIPNISSHYRHPVVPMAVLHGFQHHVLISMTPFGRYSIWRAHFEGSHGANQIRQQKASLLARDLRFTKICSSQTFFSPLPEEMIQFDEHIF